MHEPPRTTSPILDESTPIKLDLTVPATSRTPIDVVALRSLAAERRQIAPQRAQDAAPSPRLSPSKGVALGGELRPARTSGGAPLPRVVSTPRSVTPQRSMPAIGGTPIVRKAEGRTLPRAFIARRRSPHSSNAVVSPPALDASGQHTGDARSPDASADQLAQGASTPFTLR